MTCAWDAYLALIPPCFRNCVDQLGKDKLLETRLRIGAPPMLIFPTEKKLLDEKVNKDDLVHCINVASKFSPWAATTLSNGYITSQGGHRVGVCGKYMESSNCSVINEPGMVNIRVARDIIGISQKLISIDGSILILGKPGSGKTTLMRDLVRQRSMATSCFISVVDEREEIFPRWNGEYCFPPGPNTDIMSGCRKGPGMLMMLKNMTPEIIAVDEITDQEDCDTILKIGWCGVSVYATAHATSLQDLDSRTVYQPLIRSGLFKTIVIMHSDKTWHLERIPI